MLDSDKVFYAKGAVGLLVAVKYNEELLVNGVVGTFATLQVLLYTESADHSPLFTVGALTEIYPEDVPGFLQFLEQEYYLGVSGDDESLDGFATIVGIGLFHGF